MRLQAILECSVDDVIRSQNKSKLWTTIAMSKFELEKRSTAQNVANWTGYQKFKFQFHIQISKFWQVSNLRLPFHLYVTHTTLLFGFCNDKLGDDTPCQLHSPYFGVNRNYVIVSWCGFCDDMYSIYLYQQHIGLLIHCLAFTEGHTLVNPMNSDKVIEPQGEIALRIPHETTAFCDFCVLSDVRKSALRKITVSLYFCCC